MTVDLLTAAPASGLEPPVSPPLPDASVDSASSRTSKSTAASDSISLSPAARAIAARDGERSPALFTLSKSEQSTLQAGETAGHGWHDDAQTGALLLRANASPSYVARFVSPSHLQAAYRLDSARDARSDAPLNKAVVTGIHAVGDTISAGRNGVQSTIATGHLNLHPTAAEADRNRATVRQRIAETLSQSTDPATRTVGSLYANYDRSSPALRGALDTALDTATDPLTYAAGGADAIGGIANRLAAQVPHLLDAGGAAVSAALRTVDEIGAGFGKPLGKQLQVAGAGGAGSLERTSVTDLGRLDKRIDRLDGPENARGSFQKDELAGGHTIEKHIGQDDRQLRARLKREGKDDVSTFSTAASASRAYSDFANTNGPAIEKWLASGAKKNFTATVDCGSIVGRVLSRGADATVATSSALFSLKADASSPKGWYVLTSYPVLK